jgi:NTP pyrophosphatase (non-canonical NTP hydrolase)
MPHLLENPNRIDYHLYRGTDPEEVLDHADPGVIEQGFLAMVMLSHGIALSRGWYRDPATGEAKDRNFGEVIALMHSELSEALEAHRKGLMDDHLPGRLGVETELADLLIRVFDTVGRYGLDISGAFMDKCQYNAVREDHKLENRKDGGKAY